MEMTRTRAHLVLAVAVIGLWLAPAAVAAPPNFIDQYQEFFPTGGGNQNTGGGGGGGESGGGGGSQLPGSTIENLESAVSAPLADALQTVATSSELGAPATKDRRQKDKEKDSSASQETSATGSPASGSALPEALDTTAGSGSPYLLALALTLAALTLAGIVAAAVGRHRRGPGPTS